MNKLLRLLVLLLFAPPAHAGGVVGVHLMSTHIPNENHNNQNPGVYVRAEGWQAGAYHNSFKRLTVYGVRVVEIGGGLELALGAATGYKRDEQGRGFSRSAVAPMAALSYAPSWSVGGFTPRVTFVPPLPKHSGVVHLSVEKAL